MNAALRAATALAGAFNEAPVWRRTMRVWDQRISTASFDRWLYVQLHRRGAMGTPERALLGTLVGPGMTVVDVGANLGLYTVLLSKLVGPSGRVFAFEPEPGLFDLLGRNAAQNSAGNIIARRIALGNRREQLKLHRLPLNAGDTHLGGERAGMLRTAVPVDVVPLDELEPGLRPDFVKIDVQGWEFPVLQGMRGILAETRRVQVQLEFWPGGARRAGFDPLAPFRLLHELGFELRLEPAAAPLDATGLAALADTLTGLRHVDILARRPA